MSASRTSWVTNRAAVRTERRSSQELALQVEAGDRIEGGEGLVEQQQGRLGGQGAGDSHPLLLAPGELARQPGAKLARLEAHGGQQFLHPGRDAGGGHFSRRGTSPTFCSTVQCGNSPES